MRLKVLLSTAVLCCCAGRVLGQDLLNDTIGFSGATLNLKQIANPGVGQLISLTSRPGDNRNIYATSQYGNVLTIDPQGNTHEWFNYDSAVNAAIENASNGYVLDEPGSTHGGLRSIAFHPAFEINGKFYTSAMIDRPSSAEGIQYLGNSSSGFDAESAVVEWTYDHQANQIDPASYRELFRVQMPVFDHPIKQISFNPYAQSGDEDYGLLYIAHGDGSVQSATSGGGQNPEDALGKVLRIDPLQQGDSAYTTPNNPYVGVPGTLDEIYTLGHRNPHHIAFGEDSQGNGHVIVAEAGRDNIEEVNVLQAGGDYGWSDREGTFVHQNGGGYLNGVTALPSNEWELNDYIYPAAQYDHDANPGDGYVGSAIAGGIVIDNDSDPALQGQYIFADFGSRSGYVYHAALADLLAAHTQLADGELPADLTQAEIFRATLMLDSDGDGSIDQTADNLKSLLGVSRSDIRFGRGPNGELYLSSKQTGAVYVVTNTVLPAPSLRLLYDAQTGGVVIDTAGENLTAYVLEGIGFLEENHVQVLGETQSSTDSTLSEADPFEGANGLLSIGAVLPANLSASAFESYFGTAIYTTSLGVPRATFQLDYIALSGDADQDGDIDDFDLLNAISNFTGSLEAGVGGKGVPEGDTDTDADVDDFDLLTMISGFTGSLSSPVPEPVSLAVFVVMGHLLLARRPGTVHIGGCAYVD